MGGGGGSPDPKPVSRVSRKTEDEKTGIKSGAKRNILGSKYLQMRKRLERRSLFGEKDTLG